MVLGLTTKAQRMVEAPLVSCGKPCEEVLNSVQKSPDIFSLQVGLVVGSIIADGSKRIDMLVSNLVVGFVLVESGVVVAQCRSIASG